MFAVYFFLVFLYLVFFLTLFKVTEKKEFKLDLRTDGAKRCHFMSILSLTLEKEKGKRTSGNMSIYRNGLF